MRRSTTVQTALVLAGLTALILPQGQSLAHNVTVDVHAHRGGAGLAPENTLAAFRNALTMGVDVLEMGIGTLRGDGIITNYPDRLIALLRAKGLRR